MQTYFFRDTWKIVQEPKSAQKFSPSTALDRSQYLSELFEQPSSWTKIKFFNDILTIPKNQKQLSHVLKTQTGVIWSIDRYSQSLFVRPCTHWAEGIIQKRTISRIRKHRKHTRESWSLTHQCQISMQNTVQSSLSSPHNHITQWSAN